MRGSFCSALQDVSYSCSTWQSAVVMTVVVMVLVVMVDICE